MFADFFEWKQNNLCSSVQICGRIFLGVLFQQSNRPIVREPPQVFNLRLVFLVIFFVHQVGYVGLQSFEERKVLTIMAEDLYGDVFFDDSEVPVEVARDHFVPSNIFRLCFPLQL